MSIITYAGGFETERFIADWREFYKQVHSMDLDPTDLKVPTAAPGMGWGVWTPQGVGPQRAYDMGLATFSGKCWKWTSESLDIAIPKSVRTADAGPYVVLTPASVEPPSDFKGVTARETEKRKINILTFVERFLLGQWYFSKSGGQHLDVQGITRCDGSRYFDGSVPDVYFSSLTGKVFVYFIDADDPREFVRPRQAVS